MNSITNNALRKNSHQIILALFLLILIMVSCKEKPKYEVTSMDDIFASTKLIPDSHFLGDNNCKVCHQDEFKHW